MHRFPASSKNIVADKIIICDKAEVYHAKVVLRLKAGEKVVAFDEKGVEYACSIGELTGKEIILKVEKKNMPGLKNRVSVCVACSLPKKSKMDDIIDKLTQLGVDRIIPMVTERVIVKLDDGKRVQRLERWKKIALSSAKQSQRSSIPAIEPIRDVEEALKNAESYDLKLIGALSGEKKTLKEALKEAKPKRIIIFIGPEGDFTPDELRLAKEAGCIPVTLGETVLRVETAAVCAASFVKLYENH